MRDVEITTEYITLGQLLKLSGELDTGGDARAAIAEGGITVNGEAEGRRGRKLRPGDEVLLASGVGLRVVAAS